MTKPEDQTHGPEAPRPDPTPPEAAPRPAVPSWVDEVVRAGQEPASPPAARTDDLRLPETPERQPTPVSLDGAADLRLPGSPQPTPTVITATARPQTHDDDWIARATGGAAKAPTVPTEPGVTPSPSGSSPDWGLPQRAPSPPDTAGVPGDTSQKKLIAGVLAILLGSLGVHKFYLGMNTPGITMLAVSVGVWIVALLLGLITLGLGLFITLPLAALVSGALGLVGLIEGVLYLTKSDGEFYREYVLGKRPWF